MIAVARYLLAAQLRGRTLVAPAAAILIGIVLIYSVAPNPVLDTARSAAVFLFFAQAWLAFAAFRGHADRLAVAAAIGPARLARGRLIAAWVLAVASAAVAVAYPTVVGRFDGPPSTGELALCLLVSLAATTGGTGVAALFAPPLVRDRAVAAMGVAGCMLLTTPLGWPAALAAGRAAGIAAAAMLAAAVVVACPALWRE